jgi:hypothetical protein
MIHDTSHRRCKHIALSFHSVVEHVAREDVTLHYIPNKENTADQITEPSGKCSFECCTTAHVSYTVNIQTPLFQGILGTMYLK